MKNNLIESYSQSYNKKGTVLIDKEQSVNPINSTDLLQLLNCCNDVEKEFIKIGDAGEENNLLVGRFMTDVKKPEVVKNPYSQKVIPQ